MDAERFVLRGQFQTIVPFGRHRQITADFVTGLFIGLLFFRFFLLFVGHVFIDDAADANVVFIRDGTGGSHFGKDGRRIGELRPQLSVLNFQSRQPRFDC